MTYLGKYGLTLIFTAVASLSLGGCSAQEVEEPSVEITTEAEPETSQQDKYKAQLADILESDLAYYDNFSPSSKRYDCSIGLLKDSLFGSWSLESEECVDWILGFEPVIERLNTRLSLLPEFEDNEAEQIKNEALSESEIFLRTLTCTDSDDWDKGEKFGDSCADLWSTKADALEALVNQRSDAWYSYIASQP